MKTNELKVGMLLTHEMEAPDNLYLVINIEKMYKNLDYDQFMTCTILDCSRNFRVEEIYLVLGAEYPSWILVSKAD